MADEDVNPAQSRTPTLVLGGLNMMARGIIAERCLKVAGGFNPRIASAQTTSRSDVCRNDRPPRQTSLRDVSPALENRGLKPPATFKHRSAMDVKFARNATSLAQEYGMVRAILFAPGSTWCSPTQ